MSSGASESPTLRAEFMPEFRVCIGIPASGKSTAAARWAEEEGFIIVASDDLRLELTGSMEDFTKEHEVWSRAALKVAYALAHECDVALDATSLIPEYRKLWVDIAASNGIVPIAYRFPVPFEEARARNEARERVVPEFVMDQMIDNWNAYCSVDQLLKEGFRV